MTTLGFRGETTGSGEKRAWTRGKDASYNPLVKQDANDSVGAADGETMV
jgi:hypothetical protein